MKVSVIVPAYNEEVNIMPVIGNIKHTLEEGKAKNIFENYEIIVVDDGSTDRTFEILKENFQDDPTVIIHKDISNMGKGWALKNGFFLSSGDIVVFIDADLDIPTYQILNLVEILKNEEYTDIVVASKWHPLSNVKYPLLRKILSYGFFKLSQLLFGLPVKDTQTGLKAFRRNVLDAIFKKIVIKRFAFDLELLVAAHHLGFNIKSVPVEINYSRKSRINLRTAYSMFVDTLAIYHRLKILKYYDIPYMDVKKTETVGILTTEQNKKYVENYLKELLQRKNVKVFTDSKEVKNVDWLIILPPNYIPSLSIVDRIICIGNTFENVKILQAMENYIKFPKGIKGLILSTVIFSSLTYPNNIRRYMPRAPKRLYNLISKALILNLKKLTEEEKFFILEKIGYKGEFITQKSLAEIGKRFSRTIVYHPDLVLFVNLGNEKDIKKYLREELVERPFVAGYEFGWITKNMLIIFVGFIGLLDLIFLFTIPTKFLYILNIFILIFFILVSLFKLLLGGIRGGVSFFINIFVVIIYHINYLRGFLWRMIRKY